MNLPILKHMQKVPGGLMIVPMLITAIINTVWPEALQIGGSTTGAFSTGTMTIIGIVLVISGSRSVNLQPVLNAAACSAL